MFCSWSTRSRSACWSTVTRWAAMISQHVEPLPVAHSRHDRRRQRRDGVVDRDVQCRPTPRSSAERGLADHAERVSPPFPAAGMRCRRSCVDRAAGFTWMCRTVPLPPVLAPRPASRSDSTPARAGRAARRRPSAYTARSGSAHAPRGQLPRRRIMDGRPARLIL
jgi:hypothetical protein